ncbi:probable inactive shikimate kinase like 1, chloroplastic isoform X2 [Musa acuminata AAA Group]|uniref:probable inactive shikimate kinase like 1, chloroplastic isoform X2 n=1 Tax=Musa acuminata AAA Group TaxID=214697 RepID=UPI0031CE4E90
MATRAAASLAVSTLFPPPNRVLPSSPARIPSSSVAKPSVFLASPAAIREPRSRSRRSTRAYGFSGANMSVAAQETSLAVKKKAAEILNDLKGTSIFLVGMNCTMKTDLGKILADALRYCYFDSDSLVEQAAGGVSAAKSLRKEDEKGFRDSETEVLKQLSSMGRLVVCAGDGSVQTSTNLAYLRHGISIWVDVPLDYLANEMLMGEVSSPITVNAPESDSFSEVLESLMQQYNELKEGFGTADTTVSLQKVASQLGCEDFTSVTPEVMVLEVLKGLERLMSVKKMIEAAAKPF